ncbi:DUF4062 domain-containing protein [Flavobacterium sp. RSP29]|uniref:DUF4062 domain-containing protein n=1 Tax=Flavobacterium sp. RSP29 TaxID=3401731 RepID=UPI003AB08600
MPSTVTKYKIFLASPSDLKNDRSSIDEVIKELNISYGKQNDIFLELLKWETHSAPGISTIHPQNIINSDLGTDYDLFIGIIWGKFGTPTETAESGTEEEFLNAYNRFQQKPTSLQILFYFKNAPISMNEIKPDQVKKIQEFKSEIGNHKKTLYFEYNDCSELNQFLRIHIPIRINDLKNSQLNLKETIETKPIFTEVIEEEYGLIDFQIMMQEYVLESNQSLNRISEATTWIGEQFNKKTTEIGTIVASGNQTNLKIIKDFFIRTAKVMDNYANRIEPEIPIFFDNFEKTIDSMSNLYNITRNDLTISDEEIESTNNCINILSSGIISAINGMTSFLSSIEGFPRMSKEFNKANTNVVEKLEDLLAKLKTSYSIAIELQKSIQLR